MPSATTHPQTKPMFADTTAPAKVATVAASSTKSTPPKPRRVSSSQDADGVASQPTATPSENNSSTPSHKRCVECGNVFHWKLSFCTSCCRAVSKGWAWEPAVAPVPGEQDGEGGEDESDESSVSDDAEEPLGARSSGTDTSSSDDVSGDSDTDDSGEEHESSSDDEPNTLTDTRPTPGDKWQRGGNAAMTDALFG
jgi:hypothetical protein